MQNATKVSSAHALGASCDSITQKAGLKKIRRLFFSKKRRQSRSIRDCMSEAMRPWAIKILLT